MSDSDHLNTEKPPIRLVHSHRQPAASDRKETPGRTGFVSLVGAGPGDPELLTIRALSRLEKADLVLYDALVVPDLLALAPRARRCFVGKRRGTKSVEQATISGLMIRAAHRGQRVVRLKCGDAFVLGRGGEEILALARAGIPFEVVPGVSSAISAPALVNIPVTHRGAASGFLVVTGHGKDAFEPLLQSLRPNSLTVVVLMGVSNRAEIAQTLLDQGWHPETPAALIFSASTPKQRLWTTELRSLVTRPLPEEVPKSAPGTLVIGETVKVAQTVASLQELGHNQGVLW